MFSLPYLYYYLIASFFSFMLRRSAMNSNSSVVKNGSSVDFILSSYQSPSERFVCNNSGLLKFLGSVCALASIIFLILGFWYMPEWWYPLVFIGLSLLATTFIPISDNTAGVFGAILAPIACVLMYLSLFGVIS